MPMLLTDILPEFSKGLHILLVRYSCMEYQQNIHIFIENTINFIYHKPPQNALQLQ